MTDLSTLAQSAKAWPFELARALEKRVTEQVKAGERAAGAPVIFETGYGPSGLPHIGTFGEVVRTTMVRHALETLTAGRYATRLICYKSADRTFKRPALALFAEEGCLNCPLAGLPASFPRCSPVPDSLLPICPTPPSRLNPLPFAAHPVPARIGPSPPLGVAAGDEESSLQVSHQLRMRRRCPCPEGQLGLARIRDALLHMRQNLRNDFRLLDAGDHPELATAAAALVDLDAEHALEALSPSHGDVARGDGLIGVGGIRFAAHTPMRWRHRRTQLAVRREYSEAPYLFLDSSRNLTAAISHINAPKTGCAIKITLAIAVLQNTAFAGDHYQRRVHFRPDVSERMKVVCLVEFG
jgi:hypothetical protein